MNWLILIENNGLSWKQACEYYVREILLIWGGGSQSVDFLWKWWLGLKTGMRVSSERNPADLKGSLKSVDFDWKWWLGLKNVWKKSMREIQMIWWVGKNRLILIENDVLRSKQACRRHLKEIIMIWGDAFLNRLILIENDGLRWKQAREYHWIKILLIRGCFWINWFWLKIVVCAHNRLSEVIRKK